MSPEMRTRRDGTLRPRRKGAVQPWTVVWMGLVWCLFWRDLSIANVLSGAVLGVAIQWAFPLPPLRLEGGVRLGGLVAMLWMFVTQMLLASFEVAGHVLRPKRQPQPAVVEIDLRSESDFVLTIVSLIISLVPGSVVVEARRSTHTLFIHVLDAQGTDGVEKARARALDVETYVVRAFPPKRRRDRGTTEVTP
jgi:multicomponent Na+:H+ antiporter subunit E